MEKLLPIFIIIATARAGIYSDKILKVAIFPRYKLSK